MVYIYDAKTLEVKSSLTGQETAEAVPQGLFQGLFSRHYGALELRANGYVIAAKGSALCIFRTTDGSAGSEHAAMGSARGAIGAGKPETAAVAFFQCSSDIKAFDIEGGNIAVGCADGQVLQLFAAVLQTQAWAAGEGIRTRFRKNS